MDFAVQIAGCKTKWYIKAFEMVEYRIKYKSACLLSDSILMWFREGEITLIRERFRSI
jgi:hypothetical protein